MAILRANEINKFLQSPPPEITGVLIYGPNEGRVSEISRQIVAKVTGTLDDPFNLVFLNDIQLKEQPGILRDEMLAISFTGSRKVIWVKDHGPAFNRQIVKFFDVEKLENLLVVQAGSLTKSSAVRKIFEKSKSTLAIACYEETPIELAAIIKSKVKEEGKEISPGTIKLLIDSVGVDRSLILSEVEKLLNYCAQNDEITAKSVELLTNDPISGNLDELCDLTFLGNIPDCTEKFRILIAGGIAAPQVLSSITRHLELLLKYRIEIDRGQSATMVIKTTRPPVFFKRQAALQRQISIWNTVLINRAQKIVFNATLLTRNNPGLAESICERALINLSKTAFSLLR